MCRRKRKNVRSRCIDSHTYVSRNRNELFSILQRKKSTNNRSFFVCTASQEYEDVLVALSRGPFVSGASLNYYRRGDVWFNESSWETFLCLHIQIYTEQHKWRYHLLFLRVFRPIKPTLCERAAQRLLRPVRKNVFLFIFSLSRRFLGFYFF